MKVPGFHTQPKHLFLSTGKKNTFNLKYFTSLANCVKLNDSFDLQKVSYKEKENYVFMFQLNNTKLQLKKLKKQKLSLYY